MKRTLPQAEDMFQDLREDLRRPRRSTGGTPPPILNLKVLHRRGVPLLEPLKVSTAEDNNAFIGGGESQLAAASASTTTDVARRKARSRSVTSGWVGDPLASSDAKLAASRSDEVETQRVSLNLWMQRFSHEIQQGQSCSLTAELLLHQVNAAIGETEDCNDSGMNSHAAPWGRAKPHPLRLAAICTVAENVCDTVGRFRHLLRPVLDELYASVYLPAGTAASKDELRMTKAIDMGLQAKETVYLQRFLSRKPYFEEVAQLNVAMDGLKMQIIALSSSKSAGKSVLDRLGESWRNTTTRMVLRAWYGAATRARTQNSIMNRFLGTVVRRDRLQTHFYAWRLVTKELQLSRSRNEYAGGIEQLVQMEATSSARCTEVEDQLQESRMVVARLKVEKDLQRMEREQLQNVLDGALNQAEGWRKLTADVVSFLGGMKRFMAAPKSLLQVSQLLQATEDVQRTLLGWVGRLLEPLSLPASWKIKVSNFNADMKDGQVLLVLMHVLTNGEVDLRVCQDVLDVRGRMQIVMDSITTLLGMNLPFGIDDVCPPTPEMNFFILYLLWNVFEQPPLPAADTVVGQMTAYRDDLEATARYVEQAKKFYPAWLDMRNLLQQYALFVLFAKLKNAPVMVLCEEESAQLASEVESFTIKSPLHIPSAFLSGTNLSAAQNFQNEEERHRANAVLTKHLGVLRHLFSTYATARVLTSDAAAFAAGRGSKKANGKGSGKEKGREPSNPPAFLVEIDAMGFYRLCADCNMVKRGVAPSTGTAGKPGAGGGAKGNPQKQRAGGGGGGREGASTAQILSEPRQFFKLAILAMFADVASKFALHVSETDPDQVCMDTMGFVTLLGHLAVHRYGQPVTPASVQPAPLGTLLEVLVQKDLMACVGIVRVPTFFNVDLVHDSVQRAVLAPRRPLLHSLFAKFCNKSAAPTVAASTTVASPVSVTAEPVPTLSAGVSYHSKSLALSDAILLLQCSLRESTFSRVERYVEELFHHSSQCLLPSLDARQSDSESPASPGSPASPSGSPVSRSASGAAQVGASPVALTRDAVSFAVGFGSPHGDVRLIYGEFEIFLASLSYYVEPAPFLPLASKLEALLDEILEVREPAQSPTAVH